MRQSANRAMSANPVCGATLSPDITHDNDSRPRKDPVSGVQRAAAVESEVLPALYTGLVEKPSGPCQTALQDGEPLGVRVVVSHPIAG